MTTQDDNVYDLLLAGQGASGYAAVLYAARYQIKTVIFGSVFGGETATGGLIENYPGILKIDGFDLMMKFREQAESPRKKIRLRDLSLLCGRISG